MKRNPNPISRWKNSFIPNQIKKQILTASVPEHLSQNPNAPALMNKQKSENYELIKRHFDKVILANPNFTVSKTIFIKVMMNKVAIALQQNNSYEKQDYSEHYSFIHTSSSSKRFSFSVFFVKLFSEKAYLGHCISIVFQPPIYSQTRKSPLVYTSTSENCST